MTLSNERRPRKDWPPPPPRGEYRSPLPFDEGLPAPGQVAGMRSETWFGLTPTGLFSRGHKPSFDELEGLLWELGTTHRSIHFWIGDALNLAELFYPEDWSQLIPDLPVYSLKTMQNDKWVCNQIIPSRRRESLSFGHHSAVAGLEPADQDHFLDRAETEGLSVAVLTHLIAEKKRGKPARQIPLDRALKSDLRSRVEELNQGIDRIAALPDPEGLITAEIVRLKWRRPAIRPDVVLRAWFKADRRKRVEGLYKLHRQARRFKKWLVDWAAAQEVK